MNGGTALFGAVMWLTAGFVVALVMGPLLRRGAEAAGPPVSPRAARPNTLASRRVGSAAAGGVFLVGLLVGGTGLAAAGSLPGPAQDVARDVLRQVGIEVPAVDEPDDASQVATGIGEGDGNASRADDSTRGGTLEGSADDGGSDGLTDSPACAEHAATEGGEPVNRPRCSDAGEDDEVASGPLPDTEVEVEPNGAGDSGGPTPGTDDDPVAPTPTVDETPPGTEPGDPTTTITIPPVDTTLPPVTTTTTATVPPPTLPAVILPPSDFTLSDATSTLADTLAEPEREVLPAP